jgi:preprotein translocase subunit SecG
MIVLLSQFSFGLFLMAVLLTLASIFMILLILVQQGRGGGLTGALGGMGGQSAFGTKAGDLFTRITIVTAIIWITFSIFTIAFFNPPPPAVSDDTSLDLSGAAGDMGLAEPDPNAPAEKEDTSESTDGVNLNPPAEAVPSQTDPAEGDKPDPAANPNGVPPANPSLETEQPKVDQPNASEPTPPENKGDDGAPQDSSSENSDGDGQTTPPANEQPSNSSGGGR